MPQLHLVADLHLGQRSTNQRIESTLARLRLRERPEDWLLVAGDVTDSGAAAEYDEALRLLSPWGGRIVLAPGNHDLGTLGLAYSVAARRRWARLVAALRAPAEVAIGGWLVRAYDTCLLTASPLDLAQGRLGVLQRRRLPGHLERARRLGLRPAVVQHHWPYCDDPTLRQLDAAEELAIVEGRADLWAGHTHHAEVREREGFVLRCLGSMREGAEPVTVGG